MFFQRSHPAEVVAHDCQYYSDCPDVWGEIIHERSGLNHIHHSYTGYSQWLWCSSRVLISQRARYITMLSQIIPMIIHRTVLCIFHDHQSSSFIVKNQYCVMKKRDLLTMNEMDLKFSKIVIFPNQYKILEIRKCYSTALMSTFDIP